MGNNPIYYDNDHITFLEKLWGDGYLSPGGTGEVKRMLRNIDLSSKTVLDIGCGSGGVTTSLVTDYKAKRVTGIDIEEDVCKAAQKRVQRLGLSNSISIVRVELGALKFADQTFDVVFSKDSLVHIEDKETISKEIFRVLKWNGDFICSDWLRSHDGEPSSEMAHYLKLEDLGFDMASPRRYESALKLAGFKNILFENRNKWYLEQARNEILTLSQFKRKEFEAISSEKYMDLTVKTWKAMIKVLETGEHCPHHIRCRKSK